MDMQPSISKLRHGLSKDQTGGTLVHTEMEWGLCGTLYQGQLPCQQEPEDMLKPRAEESWAQGQIKVW